jgi:serine protease Do
LVAVDARLRGHLGLEEGHGALVVAVRPESEAARLGLLADDVITAIDGSPVRSLDEVSAAIRGLAPGAALAVDVIRQGKPLTLSRPAK